MSESRPDGKDTDLIGAMACGCLIALSGLAGLAVLVFVLRWLL